MRNHPGNRLVRWLTAERTQTAEQAERALQDLFGVLVDPMPTAGFADRVMLAVASVPQAASLARGWRLTLAACLVLAALSFAFAPLVVLMLAELARIGSVIELIGSGVVLASRALVDWLSFWQSLVGVNRVLVTVISRPSVAALLIAVAVLTTVSFRLFAELMVAKRSTHHG
jgi:hypothetical protein